jgi:gliding motility-associated-like protein
MFLMRSWILLFVLSSLNGLAQSTVPSYVPPSGLVSWWPLDTQNGANDLSSGSHHGVVYNTAVGPDRFGIAGGAFTFNGSNSRVEIPAHADFNTPQVSVSVWVKPDDALRGRELVYKADMLTAASETYSFSNQDASIKNSSQCRKGQGWRSNLFPSLLTAGTWQHVCFTADGTTLKWYLNGTLMTQIALPGTVDICSSNLRFGYSHESGGNNSGIKGDPWLGALDDIGIWNRALTPCEVRQLYQSSVTNAGSSFRITQCAGTSYNFNGSVLTTSGTYTDTVTTPSGCDSIVTLYLTFNPTYQQTRSFRLCPNQTYAFGPTTITGPGIYTNTFQTVNGCDSTVTLNVTFLNALGDTVQAASCGDSSFNFGPNRIERSGTYRHTFTSVQGCDSTVVLIYKAHPVPTALFTTTPEERAVNKPFVLVNNAQNATRYVWDFGDGTTSTEKEPSHQYLKSGTYTICLTSLNDGGCSDRTCLQVNAEVNLGIEVPTAFSPNGDGKNDVLYVRGGGIRSFALTVYNRWGQKIFETADMAQGWDGQYQGATQGNDVFAYILTATFINGTGVQKTGSITVMP